MDPVNGEEFQHDDSKLLKIHRKLAYAAGNFLTVLAVALWFPYNITFFTKVVGLSSKNAGYVVLIGQVGGAISVPIIGMWSDRCRCRIPGRRKIFHLVGIFIVAIFFFFLWFHCLGCENAPSKYVVLYYGVFAVIFQAGWASIQLGQLALMPELSTQKRVLVELNSLRYVKYGPHAQA
jgi:Na+/melibiose symporter-like transporter